MFRLIKSLSQLIFLLFVAFSVVMITREWSKTKIFEKLSLERRCQMGDGTACLNLSSYDMGPVYIKITGRTPFFFTMKGCHFGNRQSCLLLVTKFKDELIKLPDSAQLISQSLNKSCLLGEGKACSMLAQVHIEQGDMTGASELRSRACWFGDSKSCLPSNN